MEIGPEVYQSSSVIRWEVSSWDVLQPTVFPLPTLRRLFCNDYWMYRCSLSYVAVGEPPSCSFYRSS